MKKTPLGLIWGNFRHGSEEFSAAADDCIADDCLEKDSNVMEFQKKRTFKPTA
jgi:hypothetical protein